MLNGWQQQLDVMVATHAFTPLEKRKPKVMWRGRASDDPRDDVRWDAGARGGVRKRLSSERELAHELHTLPFRKRVLTMLEAPSWVRLMLLPQLHPAMSTPAATAITSL